MKILQVINSLQTGGAEKLLLDSIPLYREQGVEMDILLLWDNDEPFVQKLQELKCCKVHILQHSNNYKDIYNPLHIFRVRKVMKNYDIIHVHLFPAQYFVALANIGLNKRLVFTEHSTTNKRMHSKWLSYVDKYIYLFYKCIVAISEDVAKQLDFHIPGANVIVIHNGVNVANIFSAKPYYRKDICEEVSEKDYLIAQTSAFREGKQQNIVIKALRFLPPNVKLLLIGTGDERLRQDLVKLIFNFKLRDRVIFLGQRMDIPNILKSVDVNVLSSKYEGLSLSSIEGLASGKPFVASDVPGLHDIVDGAGILFEQGNARQLATVIERLMSEPDYALAIGQQGIARAKQFDIKTMVQKHIELYKEVYG